MFPIKSTVRRLLASKPRLLVVTKTPYNKLAVAQLNNLRTLYIDNYVHSEMYVDRPDDLVDSAYTEYFHLGIELNPHAKKILFVGGGGFSGPKNFLKTYSHSRIDVVEIDPVVISIGEKYFNLPKNNRLRVFNDDGRKFLLQSKDSNNNYYDVVILDAFSKNYVPFSLITREFFQLVSDNLSSNGVTVLIFVSSLKGDTSKLIRAVYKTMSEIFSTIYVFTTASKDLSIVQAIVVIATKEKTKLNKQQLKQAILNNNFEFALDNLQLCENIYEGKIETDDVSIITDQMSGLQDFIDPVTHKQYNTFEHK
jgi:spermidine synthase